MDPLTIGLILAGAGGLKGHLDQKGAAKKRQAEAEIARWSPWTGMAPQRVDDGPGILGGAMQGAMGGLGLMQSMGKGGGGAAAAPAAEAVAPPALPMAPASTSEGQVAQGYSLYGAGEQRPVWLDMQPQAKQPYSLYGSQPPVLMASR